MFKENTMKAIRRVLREATNAEHFFDYSDGERMAYLIGRGYELGIKDTVDLAHKLAASDPKQPASRRVQR